MSSCYLLNTHKLAFDLPNIGTPNKNHGSATLLATYTFYPPNLFSHFFYTTTHITRRQFSSDVEHFAEYNEKLYNAAIQCRLFNLLLILSDLCFTYW